MIQILLFIRRFFAPGDGPPDPALIGEWTLRSGRGASESTRSKASRPGGDPRGSSAGALLPRGLRSDVDSFSPSVVAILFRALRLTGDVIAWLALRVFDRLFVAWGRANRQEILHERQAVRLRELMQRRGGTMIKVGQQLAIRADIVPPAYCRELSSLLDDAEAFDVRVAEGVVEAETGRPFSAVFASFDPEPIGKASIACVFRARLHGADGPGDEVAVKIRRPEIVKSFKTDLAAIGLLLGMLELMTILRPGSTESFRDELGRLLLEELDLRIEARYQELFRRYIKGWSALRVTAPATYPGLCTERMMVSELITEALSAKELLTLVESGDPRDLRRLDELDIDPARVARDLIRASHFQFFDCPFFHGDPHPGNLLIRRGGKIVMIDFGACGTFIEVQRLYLRRMNYFQAREDIGGMVKCVIHLMEPLPPIELSSFRRDLETAWWHGFYGIQSRHAEWWERTSFRLWTALLGLVRRYKIPLPTSVLRMIRATLLYDTVGARLYPELDVFEEFRVYLDYAAERTAEDAEEWLARQLTCGIDPLMFLRFKQLADVSDSLLFEAQRFLGQPRPDFLAMIDKASEVALNALRWFFSSLTATALAFAGLAIHAIATRSRGDTESSGFIQAMLEPDQRWEQLQRAIDLDGLQVPEWILLVWLIVIALLTFKFTRTAMFRLHDTEKFLRA